MCIASPEFCVINLGSRLECASFVRYRAGAFILHDKCTATYACTCVFLYFALCPWVRAEQYVNARPWSAWGRNRPHRGEESLKMTFLNAILERTSPTLRTLQRPLPYPTPIAPLPTASLPPPYTHTTPPLPSSHRLCDSHLTFSRDIFPIGPWRPCLCL